MLRLEEVKEEIQAVNEHFFWRYFKRRTETHLLFLFLFFSFSIFLTFGKNVAESCCYLDTPDVTGN